MRILLATTLLAFSSAMRVASDIQRYSSQAECNAIPLKNDQYHYKFDKDACICAFKFNRGSHHCSGSKPKFNPLHEPFNSQDLCITLAEYNAIREHDLDSNC